MDGKKRYNITLNPVVWAAARNRAHTFGMGLSTWINYILAKTEGMVGEMDIPKAEDITKLGHEE